MKNRLRLLSYSFLTASTPRTPGEVLSGGQWLLGTALRAMTACAHLVTRRPPR